MFGLYGKNIEKVELGEINKVMEKLGNGEAMLNELRTILSSHISGSIREAEYQQQNARIQELLKSLESLFSQELKAVRHIETTEAERENTVEKLREIACPHCAKPVRV